MHKPTEADDNCVNHRRWWMCRRHETTQQLNNTMQRLIRHQPKTLNEQRLWSSLAVNLTLALSHFPVFKSTIHLPPYFQEGTSRMRMNDASSAIQWLTMLPSILAGLLKTVFVATAAGCWVNGAVLRIGLSTRPGGGAGLAISGRSPTNSLEARAASMSSSSSA